MKAKKVEVARRLILFALMMCLILLSNSFALAEGPRVTVVNTESNPVVISGRVSLLPPQGPAVASGSLFFDFGDVFKATDIYSVLPNSLLVVEYFSCSAEVGLGQAFIFDFSTTVGGSQVKHFLPITPPTSVFAQGFANLSAGQQVRAYADPGTKVTIEAIRTGSTESIGAINCYLVGHLESP